MPFQPRTLALVVLSTGLAVAAPAFARDYVQGPGSTLTFASHYQGEVFTGHFSRFNTRLSFDPAKLDDARLEVLIPLASASTANADRDETLQGPDFFSTAAFPQARYTANRFRHVKGNEYAADGILSLRGVSKPVTLTFSWTPGAQPVLNGKAGVPRLEFGVGGGDWADLEIIPNLVAVSTKVVFTPTK